MTGQGGVAGEIALRLAEIATVAGSARERDATTLRLLRERVGATFIASYKKHARSGKAPTLRLCASDEGVIRVNPALVRAARHVARERLMVGGAARYVLDDPRVGGWRVAGCLAGTELAIVALWPPDGDTAAGAQILDALAPMLSLTLGRRTRRAQNGGDDARVDAAKAEFVSLVSHALRTPLNTLTGFIEIVLDQPVGPLNERQREFLEYARASGQALTHLVEDVTLLSRADEGSLTLRYEQVDIAEIAQRALRTVEMVAEANGVTLDARVEGNSVALDCDGERLAHALAKLLENALQFSPEGGEVTLTVTTGDGLAHFVVRDEGPGVALEDMPRIFSRFYHAEGTAKSHLGGYGLGLAVAQVIARAHGGAIHVESAPQQGATFTLSIPINATSADHRTATKSRRSAPGAALRPS
jgi:signal transduction histidine kinase